MGVFIMKYIYGPVQSRRLGLSLGVSLTPHKVCDFDCIYCQVGLTTTKTAQRAEYVRVPELAQELSQWLEANPEQAGKLSYITLSGPGEPTLNTGLAPLIASIRKLTAVPVALITNGSLFADRALRAEVMGVDLIVPSLDAATQDVFEKIDRPAEGITVEGVIEGLAALRREYRGKLWLEIMLVDGVNDSAAHLRSLVEAVERIRPDKIQLNSPVRCTAEKDVKPLSQARLEKIKEMFGEKAEIV
jgi:wyosine [tRNA(Phe)-imidazoG37] synthetase (radical SAM superfamily)